MSQIERLLESSRPELQPRQEHESQLRLLLRQSAERSNDAGWLARRPEVAVLALCSAAAFICWFVSMTLATAASGPRLPSIDPMPEHVGSASAQRPMTLVAYARTLLPHTEAIDPAALQKALTEAWRDRHLAEEIAQGR